MKKLRNNIVNLKNNIINNKGMTLIEIMIVVTIIAILIGLVAPRFMDMPQKARVTAARQQIKNFSMILDAKYGFTTGTYPTTDEGLQKLADDKHINKKTAPADPWGRPYEYRSPGENDISNEYEIWSWGADGKTGGEGINADIKSWE